MIILTYSCIPSVKVYSERLTCNCEQQGHDEQTFVEQDTPFHRKFDGRFLLATFALTAPNVKVIVGHEQLIEL